MKTIQQIGLLLLASLFVTACSTTKITSSWKAANVQPKHYSKILVLGLIKDSDRSLQEKMEAHLVDDLKSKGYNAVGSLQEFGPKAFSNVTEAEALARLKQSNIDAVVTIVLLDKQKERNYVPGRMYYSPYVMYYNRFWPYYGTLNYRIYEPGYYVTDTRYFWESNVYEVSTQSLLYSVQTKSFDPANSESLGHEYGRLIIADIVKNNILLQQ
ncbi:hypothetical protein IQ13_3679 [Lacibacter cauensis]|uniref:DUF4136 domain-containing protein n=1 Tax=Lacibacter cauensis TaxID=510947 RepID=A0A562SF36_9BACT|nr:hypothetical protein [Lacibacter cauensis]TWI79276.1 hypothetical protein IQ13_3679 [Lacibacter cauensis]